MELDLGAMTWRCDICKRDRPDNKIAVAHKPLRGMEGGFPDTRFNLKFCVDNVDCVTKTSNIDVWPLEESP